MVELVRLAAAVVEMSAPVSAIPSLNRRHLRPRSGLAVSCVPSKRHGRFQRSGHLLVLDAKSRRGRELSIEIMKLFREINTRGTTVLVATHNPELIRFVGKRTIHLEHGRLDAGENQP